MLSVRSRGPLATLSRKQLAAAIADVDPLLSLTFRDLSDQVNAQFSQQRLVATMAAWFGGLALLLCAIGLHGLTAYAATQRRFELGVRLALGASPVSVAGLFARPLARAVAAGIALGVLGALWAGQLVASLLVGVTAGDAPTIAATSVVLAIVAAVVIALPTRRAVRLDLARLLREA